VLKIGPQLVVYLIVVGIIIWLLHYLVNAIPLDEPFRRVANIVIVVIGVLIVILLFAELCRPARQRAAALALGRLIMVVKCIDISHWQDFPDFEEVRAAGVIAMIHKATEGASYVNPNRATNCSNAMREGIKVCTYHWLRPRQ
jgi:Glycosyl hydrolases family 25